MNRKILQKPSNAVEAIDNIIAYAVSNNASDIHIDPYHNAISIRLRIDGVMEHIGFWDKHLHEEVIARLKILSGTRTDIHAIPQDGRWKNFIEGQEYNIRISFMPTYHGENAVLRILSSSAVSDVSFAKLGFSPETVRLIDKAMNKPNGLILITGPTGSGKTTTLNTCLSLKSREPLSIITLEDPVEYEIQGVRQVQVRQAQGFGFAMALRAALRQDPDIVMVGEIRDSETAKTAMHTALTGHLVFSTLHTNSALEAIPRLIDMGVDSYLLAHTLKLVIAQRLVRAMCHECNAGGCELCRYSGYKGRSVIAEACYIDKALSSLIFDGASLDRLRDGAKSYGFHSLEDDGREKVDWGITTKEEIMRVLYY